MAEPVEGLELQITENSTAALKALEKLAGAMQRLRTSIGRGIDLSGTVRQIDSLRNAVQAAQSAGTAEYLNKIADALQRLKQHSDIKLPNLKGQKDLGQFMDAVGKSANAAADAEKTLNGAFSDKSTYAPQVDTRRLEAATNDVKKFADVLDEAVERQSSSIPKIEKEWEQLKLPPISMDQDEDEIMPEDVVWTPEEIAEEFAYIKDVIRRRFGQESDAAWTPEDVDEFAENAIVAAGRVQDAFSDMSDAAKDASVSMVPGEDKSRLDDWMDYTVSDMDDFAENAAGAAERARDAFSGMGDAAREAAADMGYDTVEVGRMRDEFGMAADSVDDFNNTFVDIPSHVETATDSTGRFRAILEGAREELRNYWQEVKNAGLSLKTFAPLLSKVLSAFGRIAFYRAIRAAIRAITQGFKTGIENVYQYSKAVGTTFAGAMDAAKNAVFKMNNSLGAALAPALQALIPILQQVISYVIMAANYVNQFFALLGGARTWTRATDAAASSLDNVKNSAGGAAGAVKNLLADFDELNVIQSQGGGGGGGGGGTALADYGLLFEEVDSFDSKIRDIVSFINDNAEDLLDIVKQIGRVFLMWQATKLPFLTGIFGLIGLGAVTIPLVFKISTFLNEKFLETGETGWLLADVLTTAMGATLAWQAAKRLMGGNLSVAAVSASVMLVVSAFAGLYASLKHTDVSALSRENLLSALENAVKVGAAGFLVARNVPALKAQGALSSFGFAAGATLLWIGAQVGIKALKGMVDSSAITKENVTASILGSLASGLGVGLVAAGLGATAAASFAAGGIVFATGLVISGIVALRIIVGGKNKPEIKWGNIDLTQDQVREFVEQEMFTGDIRTSLGVLVDNFDQVKSQKDAIKERLESILGDFKVIQLGLAAKQDYSELHESINGSGGLIDQVTAFIDEAKQSGKLTLSIMPEIVGNTTDEQMAWYTEYTSGWEKVETFYTEKGRQLGELLSKAEQAALSENETQLLQTLMAQMANVTSALTDARVVSEAMGKMRLKMGDLTKASATDVLNAVNDTTNEIREGLQTSAYEMVGVQGELVRALYEIDPSSPEYLAAKAKYEEMLDGIYDGVEAKVVTATEPARQAIREWIETAFADAIDGADLQVGLFGNVSTAAIRALDTALRQGTLTEAVQKIVSQVTQIPVEALQALNTTGVEYLMPEVQEQLNQAIMKNTEFWPLITKALGMSGQGITLPVPVERVEIEAKDGYIDLQSFLPKTGEPGGAFDIPIPEVDNSEAIESVEEIAEAIAAIYPEHQSLFDEPLPPVDNADAIESIDEIAEAIVAIYPEHQSLFDEPLPSMDNADAIESIDEVAEAFKVLPDTYVEFTGYLAEPLPEVNGTGFIAGLTSLADDAEAQARRIESHLILIAQLANGLGNWRKTYGGYWGSYGRYTPVPLGGYAEGGFPNEGQLFLANERGPELVGTIGGKTAVANSDQIISGVASGVAAGQAEQNALLRQQNDYLRRILAKESSVRVEPSAGWGKFNRQSEAMYARNTGT